MKTNLAQELRRYYVRTGNRVLFRNGMTLNKVAEEMYERMNYREIEPSVISRAINGIRLFTARQVEVFGNSLELTCEEQIGLYEALIADLEERAQSKKAMMMIRRNASSNQNNE